MQGSLPLNALGARPEVERCTPVGSARFEFILAKEVSGFLLKKLLRYSRFDRLNIKKRSSSWKCRSVVNSVFVVWIGAGPGAAFAFCLASFEHILWQIWKERNRRIFDSRELSVQQLASLISDELMLQKIALQTDI